MAVGWRSGGAVPVPPGCCRGPGTLLPQLLLLHGGRAARARPHSCGLQKVLQDHREVRRACREEGGAGEKKVGGIEPRGRLCEGPALQVPTPHAHTHTQHARASEPARSLPQGHEEALYTTALLTGAELVAAVPARAGLSRIRYKTCPLRHLTGLASPPEGLCSAGRGHTWKTAEHAGRVLLSMQCDAMQCRVQTTAIPSPPPPLRPPSAPVTRAIAKQLRFGTPALAWVTRVSPPVMGRGHLIAAGPRACGTWTPLQPCLRDGVASMANRSLRRGASRHCSRGRFGFWVLRLGVLGAERRRA
jgi:hypothetical protein